MEVMTLHLTMYNHQPAVVEIHRAQALALALEHELETSRASEIQQDHCLNVAVAAE